MTLLPPILCDQEDDGAKCVAPAPAQSVAPAPAVAATTDATPPTPACTDEPPVATPVAVAPTDPLAPGPPRLQSVGHRAPAPGPVPGPGRRVLLCEMEREAKLEKLRAATASAALLSTLVESELRHDALLAAWARARGPDGGRGPGADTDGDGADGAFGPEGAPSLLRRSSSRLTDGVALVRDVFFPSSSHNRLAVHGH